MNENYLVEYEKVEHKKGKWKLRERIISQINFWQRK